MNDQEEATMHEIDLKDPRLKKSRRGCWHGILDEDRVGIVAAHRSSGFRNHAMPAEDFDKLLAAKRQGNLDAAYVVLTAADRRGVLGTMEAEALAPHLEGKVREGEFGDFYLVPADFAFDDKDAPF